jgi:hypothetical protein
MFLTVVCGDKKKGPHALDGAIFLVRFVNFVVQHIIMDVKIRRAN